MTIPTAINVSRRKSQRVAWGGITFSKTAYDEGFKSWWKRLVQAPNHRYTQNAIRTKYNFTGAHVVNYLLKILTLPIEYPLNGDAI